jgi:MOSC domain-containing protein YiiM
LEGGGLLTGTITQLSISKGGVPKLAVAEAHAGPLGLEGDVQRNTKYHGGPRQALLLVSEEDLAWLRDRGYSVAAGDLGENLTVRGVDFRALRPGQRYRAGGATIELTKVRVPCSNLDVYNSPEVEPIQKAVYDAEVKAGNTASPKWALAGFYAAVLQPGWMRPGDTIALVEELA